MSSHVDLKEFLSAYLAEVDEHLQISNAKLLEIDAVARRGESHPRAVRDLFRALHTIKGLSAMVGVEPAVAISHRMEAILRAADRGGGSLSVGAVDVLLKAIVAIEYRVAELSQGKEPSAAPRTILEALDQLDAPPPAPARAPLALNLEPSLAAKLAPFELDLLTNASREGRRALRADFSPSPSKAARGLSITGVRERVSAIAEIVKVIPMSVAMSEDAPGSLTFALLILTSASNEDVALATDGDASSIFMLGEPPAPAPITPGTRSDAFVPIASEGGVVESVAPGSLLPEPDDEPGDPAGAPRRGVVRVDVARLDDAMDRLSSLIVTRSRLARAIGSLASEGVDTRELTEIMRESSRQLRDLRSAILRVRMVPVTEVLDRIPLIVRGLRRESGKQVRLKISAGDAELDKSVAERLFPAIVHLVRNAVDHAIESPDYRARIGKSEEGTLRIACSAESNKRLELTVSDDGRGVDRAAVAQRIGHEAPSSDAALLEMLCQAGLTTRDEATTTSGRGMGMDIVKRIVVGQLGGDLVMTTEKGVGTTFILRVPLTISIVDAFTIECQGQRFIVPVSMVEEILEVDPSQLRYGPRPVSPARLRRVGMIERRGETVPLIALAAALRMGAALVPDAVCRLAVVVRRGGQAMAFGVDRVLGQQEAVVRPLIDPLVQVPGIAGATDLGDGRPTLVLDLQSLGATLTASGGEERAA